MESEKRAAFAGWVRTGARRPFRRSLRNDQMTGSDLSSANGSMREGYMECWFEGRRQKGEEKAERMRGGGEGVFGSPSPDHQPYKGPVIRYWANE
jgi:hypothetical protein